MARLHGGKPGQARLARFPAGDPNDPACVGPTTPRSIRPKQGRAAGRGPRGVQIQSPRLLLEMSPSARTSKGSFIVGTEVTDQNPCSTRSGRWSGVSRQSTELSLLLDNTWFKSRRQFRVTPGRGRAEDARATGRGGAVLGELRVAAPPANGRKRRGREAGVRHPDQAPSARPKRHARGLPASQRRLRPSDGCLSARRRVEFCGTAMPDVRDCD